MKTRWLATFLVLMLGLSAGLVTNPFPASAQNPVSITIGAVAQVAAGRDFVARVNIGSVTDFDVAQYDVSYDPAVLSVTDVTSGQIGSTTVPWPPGASSLRGWRGRSG